MALDSSIRRTVDPGTRYIPTLLANGRTAPEATKRERERETVFDGNATLHPLPGDHSGVEPPDPIPNSEVKRTCADGSVA